MICAVTNDAGNKKHASQRLFLGGKPTCAPGCSAAARAMRWKASASLKKRSAAAPFSMKWANASLRSCPDVSTAWFFPSPGSRPSASNSFTPDRTTSTHALTLEQGKTHMYLLNEAIPAQPATFALCSPRAKGENNQQNTKKNPKITLICWNSLLKRSPFDVLLLQRREMFWCIKTNELCGPKVVVHIAEHFALGLLKKE